MEAAPGSRVLFRGGAGLFSHTLQLRSGKSEGTDAPEHPHDLLRTLSSLFPDLHHLPAHRWFHRRAGAECQPLRPGPHRPYLVVEIKKDARHEWHMIKRLCDIFRGGGFLGTRGGGLVKNWCVFGLRFLARGSCRSGRCGFVTLAMAASSSFRHCASFPGFSADSHARGSHSKRCQANSALSET